MALQPDYQPGQVVNMRPGYVTRNPQWEGAQGVIEEVTTKYLPKLKVLWLSGPREGQTLTTPSYMVVPEGQEELLTIDLEEEEQDS